MKLRLRDLLWLAMLALVLAVWGWDRGRLATRIEASNSRTATMMDFAPVIDRLSR